MAEERITPEMCRQRAKQCRDIARSQHNQQRKELEDIAAAWEQLCEELERNAKPDKH